MNSAGEAQLSVVKSQGMRLEQESFSINNERHSNQER